MSPALMTAVTEYFIPDGDEAREWAERELSRPIYAEAKPTIFDLWARDIGRFLADLFTAEGGGQAGPWAIVVVILIVLAALLVALLTWGIPRRSRAVAARRGTLLGASDDRSAAQLRADAERAARAGEFAEATILRYRALARGLLERDLIDPAPGATAQAIAREAATIFPDDRAALAGGASAFDEVRYLEHTGSAESYAALRDLDERLSHQNPSLVDA